MTKEEFPTKEEIDAFWSAMMSGAIPEATHHPSTISDALLEDGRFRKMCDHIIETMSPGVGCASAYITGLWAGILFEHNRAENRKLASLMGEGTPAPPAPAKPDVEYPELPTAEEMDQALSDLINDRKTHSTTDGFCQCQGLCKKMGDIMGKADDLMNLANAVSVQPNSAAVHMKHAFLAGMIFARRTKRTKARSPRRKAVTK